MILKYVIMKLRKRKITKSDRILAHTYGIYFSDKMTLQHLGRVLIDQFFKNGPTYEMVLKSKCLNLTTFTVLFLNMTQTSLK